MQTFDLISCSVVAGATLLLFTANIASEDITRSTYPESVFNANALAEAVTGAKNVYIWGIGTYGEVVLSLLKNKAECDVTAFVDDGFCVEDKEFMNLPRLTAASFLEQNPLEAKLVMALANPQPALNAIYSLCEPRFEIVALR